MLSLTSFLKPSTSSENVQLMLPNLHFLKISLDHNKNNNENCGVTIATPEFNQYQQWLILSCPLCRNTGIKLSKSSSPSNDNGYPLWLYALGNYVIFQFKELWLLLHNFLHFPVSLILVLTFLISLTNAVIMQDEILTNDYLTSLTNSVNDVNGNTSNQVYESMSCTQLQLFSADYFLHPKELKILQLLITNESLTQQFGGYQSNTAIVLKLWSTFFNKTSDYEKNSLELTKSLSLLCNIILENIKFLNQPFDPIFCRGIFSSSKAGEFSEVFLWKNHITVNLENKDMINTVSILDYFKNDAMLNTASIWSMPSVMKCTSPVNYKFWIVVHYIPIYVSNVDKKTKVLRGLFGLTYPLLSYSINQCELNQINRCPLTTQCQYKLQPSASRFAPANYFCACDQGYYRHTELQGLQGFQGSEVEIAYKQSLKFNTDNYQSVSCLPCKGDCIVCNMTHQCSTLFADNPMLITFPIGFQSFCITICLVIGGIIFHIRKNRVIKSSVWALLEIFLLGALLLYSTLLIMFTKPNKVTCLVLPWLREIGFTVMYGTLVVKVYRVLSSFQSRKAHRVHVRDQDMLKYVGGIVLLAFVFMAAGTAVNLDHIMAHNVTLLDEVKMDGGSRFFVCRARWWDIVMEICEFTFLCWGLYYCRCVRSAPSEYSEILFITIALINETVISGILHIVKHFLWYYIQPEWIFLGYFLRCHCTVTVTVALIIGPKLWYTQHPPSINMTRKGGPYGPDSHTDSVFPSNGDVDTGEVNLADMNAEDIRRELKRLYANIEMYKSKAMRRDNPHVSKRRGGRKTTHRRFSLQNFHKEHRAHRQRGAKSGERDMEDHSRVSSSSNSIELDPTVKVV